MPWTIEVRADPDNPAVVGTGMVTYTDPATQEVFSFPAIRAAKSDVEGATKLAAWVASMNEQLAAARQQRETEIEIKEQVEAALNA